MADEAAFDFSSCSQLVLYAAPEGPDSRPTPETPSFVFGDPEVQGFEVLIVDSAPYLGDATVEEVLETIESFLELEGVDDEDTRRLMALRSWLKRAGGQTEHVVFQLEPPEFAGDGTAFARAQNEVQSG
jgi:hypothetical protein